MSKIAAGLLWLVLLAPTTTTTESPALKPEKPKSLVKVELYQPHAPSPNSVCREGLVYAIARTKNAGECSTTLNITQRRGSDPYEETRLPPGKELDKFLKALGVSKENVLEVRYINLVPSRTFGPTTGAGWVIEYNVICDAGTASTTKLTMACKV